MKIYSYGSRITTHSTLTSPSIFTMNRSCVILSMLFNSTTTASFTIYITFFNGVQRKLARLSPISTEKTVYNILPLPPNVQLSISLEARLDIFGNELYLSNVSLDNNCSIYDTILTVNCTFELELICGYISEFSGHGYSWIRAQKSTASTNGPPFDHTFGDSSKVL